MLLRACLILFVTACVTYPRATAFARSDVLPTPSGLESEVRFWESVFTRYSPKHCLFHDRKNLARIYGVVRLPSGSTSYRTRMTRKYLKVLRGVFERFAAGRPAKTKLERQVLEAFSSRERSPAHFRLARKNLRCQRGVDLAPSFQRSLKHIRMVRRILHSQGLPEGLAYLPHLESGYNVRAHSRAGAKGIWQLMPATARLHGLRVGRGQDQRTDPYKSTLTAVNILKKLHKSTGSWPLAVTAYNYGANGIRRAIKKYGADYMKIRSRHKTKIFGFAAKNYYPSFLAVRNVASASEVAKGDKVQRLAAEKTRANDRLSF